MRVVIEKSEKPGKKYQAVVGNKIIHFGASGYSDYTKHKDLERKQRYIARHKAREDHSKQGMDTPGFYARHVLWNKPTVEKSIQDLNNRYKDIRFVNQT